MPSREESRVGWSSRCMCMIRLQRHMGAVARMGPGSDAEWVWAAAELGCCWPESEEKRETKAHEGKKIDFCRTLYCSMRMFWENSSHTALVALPLLDFQRQVQGSDRKVHCLRVDTSHLRETVADYISDRPCGLGSEREWETLCWHVLKLLCDSAGFWKWNRRGKAMRWTNIKGRLKPWLNMTLAKSLSSPSVHFLLFGDLLCPWTASQREVSDCLML